MKVGSTKADEPEACVTKVLDCVSVVLSFKLLMPVVVVMRRGGQVYLIVNNQVQLKKKGEKTDLSSFGSILHALSYDHLMGVVQVVVAVNLRYPLR